MCVQHNLFLVSSWPSLLSIFSVMFVNSSRPDLVRNKKMNLNFYFHTSLRCLKRFYEALLKRDFNTGAFLWIFGNFKNTYFAEHLWATACVPVLKLVLVFKTFNMLIHYIYPEEKIVFILQLVLKIFNR